MPPRDLGALVIALGLVCATVVPAGAGQGSAFVLLNASSYDDVLSVVRDIEASGGHVRHIFPNVALVTDRVDASLSRHEFVSDVRFGWFDTEDILRDYGQKAWLAARAWLGSQEHAEPSLQPELLPGPIENDALDRTTSRPPNAYFPTSEYMAGTVVLGLILPQCTGGTCTEAPWTSDQLAQVFSEVVGSTDWWIDRAAERGVPLTFVYDQGQPIVVPTQHEPINMNFGGTHCSGSGDHFIWVEDVLGTLGYSGECHQIAYNYLLDRRAAYSSDWAFAVFVANSLADADGKFADGKYAAGWRGGPFLVMTYDNGTYYGIESMDAVSAHEAGHMFWAFDQYACSCATLGGYLAIENQNCDLLSGSCLLDLPSIMRGGIAPFTNGNLDPYGAGQVGWWDTDGDGLQDVIDTSPTTLLEPYSPDPTASHELTFGGLAFDVPIGNLNPASWNPNVDMTVNTIPSVLFRVDGGAWAAATPTDGAFDDSLEYYTFTTPPLDPGIHVIEATSLNSVGNYAVAGAVDTVTVLDWADVPDPASIYTTDLHRSNPNPSGGATGISYDLAEPATVSLAIYDLSGRLVRALDRSVPKGRGEHTAAWDGRDDNGRAVAAGSYFYRLTVGAEVLTQKLIMVR